jgi:hypothetical protein
MLPSTKFIPNLTGVDHALLMSTQISSSLFVCVLSSNDFVHHTTVLSLQNLIVTSPRLVSRACVEITQKTKILKKVKIIVNLLIVVFMVALRSKIILQL